MQGILARFRAWVRVWLGIDQLVTRNTLAAHEAAARNRYAAINMAISDARSDVKTEVLALQLAQRSANAEILARLGDLKHSSEQYLDITVGGILGAAERHKEVILAKLQEINMRLTVAKVDHPSQYQPQVYDWDTVQAIAAHALETSEAPKEEELV